MMFDRSWQDFRTGLRSLRKGGLATAATASTLALGIAGVGVIFSLVQGILLRPLDYPEPDRLVQVGESQDGELNRTSPPQFRDWQALDDVFSSLAAFTVKNVSLAGEGEPVRLIGGLVTPGYFDVLAPRTAIGRTFVRAEGEPGNARSVVLSHSLWRDRYGADPNVIGRTLGIDGVRFEVVGVLPAGFSPLNDEDLWIPLAFTEEELAEDQRSERYLSVVGRMRDGVSRERAQQILQASVQRSAERDPRIEPGWRARVVDLRESLVGDVRPALFLLLGGAGFVLLLVCANVANLMASRYLGRQSEFSLRTALGADRASLLRQVAAEAGMLAIFSAGCGLFIAWAGLRAVVSYGPQDIPRLQEAGVDSTVVAVVFGVSILCTLTAAFLPAGRVLFAAPQDHLREGGARQGSGRRQNLVRDLLVACQVALALVLLVGAGLLVTTMVNLVAVDPGFEPDGVVVMRLLRPDTTGVDEALAFSDRVLDGLRAAPGVEEAGVATNVPLLASRLLAEVTVEGRVSERERLEANYESVSPDYFRALGIDMVRGRPFEAADRTDAPKVAIVNRALADRLWPEGGAVGSRVSLDGPTGPWWNVVGVADDVRRFDLSEEPQLQVLVPWQQDPWYFMTFVIKARGATEPLLPVVRRAVWEVDGNQAIATLTTMDDLLSDSVSRRKFYAMVITIFGFVAVVLTAVGLYGVMAYLAGQRRREIAIRLALGSGRTDIFRMMMRRGMVLLFEGIAVGLLSAYLLGSLFERLLYEVRSTDLTTFILATAGVSLIAAVASFIPAYRSARVDPAVVLRR